MKQVYRNPKLLDYIKLWWHCFTHMHRRASIKTMGTYDKIFCYECNGSPACNPDAYMKV